MDKNNEEYFVILLQSGMRKEAIQQYCEENECSREESEIQMKNLELKFNISQNNIPQYGIPQNNITHNTGSDDAELLQMVREGKKIQAIKYYKEKTNCGLKDAKNYVENLEKLLIVSNNTRKGISSESGSQRPSPTKTEGCFIATVCYGSYDAYEVVVLRRLRDNVLNNFSCGRLFIKIYYAISPASAKLIDKSKTVKAILRKYFLSGLVKKLEKII
ncbi:MAG: CFI-box-CTERM domain-containing protein [Ignavibacteria bacterium]|jgi:ribosomal protein L7/L12